MNLYTYVRNNPVRYVDPLGLGIGGGALGSGDDDDDEELPEWLKELVDWVKKANKFVAGKEIPVPIEPGTYVIGGETIVVKKPGTTVQIQFGEGGITDIKALTSSDFTVKNYHGTPVDVDVDYAHLNTKTGKWHATGHIWGTPPTFKFHGTLSMQ